MFTTNDGMAFSEMMDAINDDTYTYNYVVIKICNVCDGNFEKIASDARVCLSNNTFEAIHHRNKKRKCYKLSVNLSFVVAATACPATFLTAHYNRSSATTVDLINYLG
jgi:hypothetical protein